MKKNTSKKILVLLGLILTACGGDNSSLANSSSSSASTPNSTDSTSISTPSSEAPSSESSSQPSSEVSSEASSEASSHKEEGSSSSSSSQEVRYNIIVTPVDGLTIDVAQSARSEENVTVTVTINDPALKLLKILANEVEAAVVTENSEYYFVMPEGDVTITAHTTKDVAKHAITNRSSAVATLIDLPAGAVAGELVNYTLNVHLGYNFNSAIGVAVRPASVFEDTLENILPSAQFDPVTSVGSFIMPDEPVKINVGVNKANYRINLENESNLIYGISQKTESSTTFNSIWTTQVAEYKSTVEVSLRGTDTLLVEGLTIKELNQTVYLESGKSTVSFTMPYHSVTIVPVFKQFLRPIVFENSEHIEMKAFKKVDDSYVEITSALFNEIVYFKPIIANSDYGIKTLNLNYSYESGNSTYSRDVNLLEKSSTYGVDLVDGYYTYQMQKALANTVVKVTEISEVTYQDMPFVGKFVGANVYGATGNKNEPNNSPTITSSGIVNPYRTSTYYVDSVEGNVMNLSDSKGDTGFKIGFGENIIYSAYSVKSTISNDMVVAFKKLDDNDNSADYRIYYERFGKNNNYAAVSLVKNGTPVRHAFFDVEGNTGSTSYVDDVEFVMTSGQLVNDKNAAYDVVVAGQTLFKVAYNDDGGAAKRFIVDAVAGTYTGEGDISSITLNGNGGALVDGEAWTYTVVDGKVHLSHGGNSMVITLDTVNKTFTVLTSSATLNDYHGHTFSGTLIPSDGEQFKMSFTFATDTKVYMKLTSTTGSISYIPNSTWDNKDILEAQTYSIDEESGVITVNTYGQSGDPIVLTLTPSADKKSLTIGENINAYYKTAGLVITR